MARSNCRPQLLYSALRFTQEEVDEEQVDKVNLGSIRETFIKILCNEDLDELLSFLKSDKTGVVNSAIQDGDTALHIMTREGNTNAVHCLCAFGCNLDLLNDEGLAAIHIASRLGFTSIVRCLCLAGCRVDLKSRDGIMAEVMSMAHSHDDITHLINSLRISSHREEYINQLVPSNQQLSTIKLKLLGFSGVGKSELKRCLSTTILSTLWSLRLPSYSNGVSKVEPVIKAQDEVELTPTTTSTSLAYEPQENFTLGIEVEMVNMSVCGRFSIWEFSGHDAYYQVYDHFLGSSDCCHLILFPLDKSFSVQLQHCLYWLTFLKIRMAPQEPLGTTGRPNRPAKVALVGTRADLGECSRSLTGEYEAPHAVQIMTEVRKAFDSMFEIHDEIFLVDSTASSTFEIKALRQYLVDAKTTITKNTPNVTNFLRNVERMLVEWKEEVNEFPVVSWTQFVDMIHKNVNPLAGDDHIGEVIHQLQLQGDLIYLAANAQDILILEPNWLTSEQLGKILHPRSKLRSRVTGCFTVDDFQIRYPHCEALELMQILEALFLCTQCDNDGDIEYEFPHLNQVETLEGLWDKADPRYKGAVYAGVKLKPPHQDIKLMAPVYSRIQVQLRRSWQEYPEHDSDLYQWCGGSKFCCGPLESIISMEENESCIEIKVRGPSNAAYATFFFLEDLLAMIDQVLLDMCPGLVVHKFLLSSCQLSAPVTSVVHAWPPSTVFGAIQKEGLNAKLTNPYSKEEESIKDLVCLGSHQVMELLLSGADATVNTLSTLAVQQLAALLDPTHPRGADWCVLAVRLSLQTRLPDLERVLSKGNSPTVVLLNFWSREALHKATIGILANQLQEMEREDAVRIVACSAPIYQLKSEPDPAILNYPNLVSPVSPTSCDSFSKYFRDATSLSRNKDKLKAKAPSLSEVSYTSKFNSSIASTIITSSFERDSPEEISESLFTADDAEEKPRVKSNLSVGEERTVATFTLEEASSSSTASFSSIPSASAVLEKKAVGASSTAGLTKLRRVPKIDKSTDGILEMNSFELSDACEHSSDGKDATKETCLS